MSKYQTIQVNGYWVDNGIKFNSMTVALGSWDGEEDWEDESIFFYLDGANPIGNHGDFVITELSN